MRRRLSLAISRRRLISRVMSIRAMSRRSRALIKALRQADRAQRDHLMVVVHRHIEPAARVHGPVPARLALKGTPMPRRTWFWISIIRCSNRCGISVACASRRKEWPSSLKQCCAAICGSSLNRMRGICGPLRRRERLRVRHFDDQGRAAGVMENDFGDFQGGSYAETGNRDVNARDALLTFASAEAIMTLALFPDSSIGRAFGC